MGGWKSLNEMSELKIGLTLLQKVCHDYASQEDVMQGVDGEYKHALEVLKWAEELFSDPLSPALALAAIFHDIDRIVTPKVGGGFGGDRKSDAYLQHKKNHAHRSAKYACQLLISEKMDSSLVERVRFLIEHHDDSQHDAITVNDEELQVLISADTYAFFSTIAPTLYRQEGEDRLKDKIVFMVGKLLDETKAKLWETPLENALFEEIKNDVIRDYFLVNNPREKEYLYCPSCANTLVNKLIENRKLRACPRCSFIYWNNPKLVTSLIIPQDGKVLMVQRALAPLLGYWCLPGGYINYGEQPSDAAIRETKEETNLVVKVDKLVGVYTIDNDPRGFNIDIIYCGRLISGVLTPNKEVNNCKYFSIDDLPERIAYKHKAAIQDWSQMQF